LNFAAFGGFVLGGAKKSSRCSFPVPRRGGSRDSPSTLSVLACRAPRFRSRDSRATLLAQWFSKRIWLRLYSVLCIVELSFQ
jgi:hypothetical protein